MDPLIQTLIFGGGILVCGYLMGVARGMYIGTKNTLKVLYDEKLADPTSVNKVFTAKLQAKNKGQ